MMLRMRKFYLSLLVALPLIISGTATLKADDTDIYLNANAAEVENEPMVMFMLDWRPNLTSTICNGFGNGGSTEAVATTCNWDPSFTVHFTADDRSDGTIDRFELLRAVLKETMENLDGIKIGLMLNHNNNCNGNPTSGPDISGCSNGAYILSGFNSIYADDSINGNKAAFHNLLASIPVPQGNESHPYQGKELYLEYFRYLTGQGVYNGHLGWKDFGNSTASDNLDGTDGPESPDYSAIAWDTSIESAGSYVTPFVEGAVCANVYAINFMFGALNQQDDSDAAIQASFANGGMDFNLSGGGNNQFAQVIARMYQLDLANTTDFTTSEEISGVQNVTSYFVVQSPSQTERAWAEAGGTTALAWSDDPEVIVNTLTNLFTQILSVSTSFVSASVPVNVFNRAEFLDDVYIALFEAEEDGLPHWVGNVKKLKLTENDTGLFIGDVLGNPAFASDGRLNHNGLTFWTDPDGSDISDPNRFDADVGENNSTDGRSVNRGGAGQKIPDFLDGAVGSANSDGLRKLYTEPADYTNGTAATLMDLDTSTDVVESVWDDLRAAGVPASGATLNNTAWTANDYATATQAEKDEGLALIKWIRGIDVGDEDGDSSTTDVRPWLMADAIHSRPLTINYGARGDYTQANPDVRIVVSTNEGLVHMLRNTNSAGAEDGGEAWAFMPRYAMRILKRLKDNTEASPIHPYGVDGSPVVYTYDEDGDGTISGDNDKAYLYVGMRRGGRYYYALDISDPDVPKILWSISDNDSDFTELGLTFSRPTVARLSYDAHVRKPVLIFGAGYDTNKDTRNDTKGTDDSRGRGIYIVDAETGALIWKAVYGTTADEETIDYRSDMLDSIPSDVTAVDTDGNGSVDRLYVGDTGGRIWRVDLAGTNRNNWKAQFFADLGRHINGSQKAQDIRFFHAVDVVQTRDSTGAFDAVIIGSGDRPNPLDRLISSNKTPENWLFMIKDRKTTSGEVLDYTTTTSMLADLSDNCAQYSILDCSETQQTNLAKGWMIKMEIRSGEKVLSRPLTLNGAIFFTSYLPPDADGICAPREGDGVLYAVDLYTAGAVFDWDLTNTIYDGAGNEVTMHKTDRYRNAGHGIPSDPIAIRKNGQMHVITPGDNYTTTMNMNSGYKTFWYVEGE